MNDFSNQNLKSWGKQRDWSIDKVDEMEPLFNILSQKKLKYGALKGLENITKIKRSSPGHLSIKCGEKNIYCNC